MNIDALQTAILAKDANAVVAAVKDWDEEKRSAAAQPLDTLLLAFGFDHRHLFECKLNSDSPEVVAKRKTDGIVLSTRHDQTYDRRLHLVGRLARYAVASLSECQRIAAVPSLEECSAQVMADRNPQWFRQWFRQWCEIITGEEGRMEAGFWSMLFQRGMLTADDFEPVKGVFIQHLPEELEAHPESIALVMREVAACRDLIYEGPSERFWLFNAKPWISVIEWLCANDSLDQQRFIKAYITALDSNSNQTERNNCLMLIKATKPDISALAAFQSDWTRLVGDSQSSVAGFAVTTLQKLAKAKRLDAADAIAALPAIFNQSAKSHAANAIKLLTQLASEGKHRQEAVVSIAQGLLHPNKDIQAAVIDSLEKHITTDDDEAMRIISASLDGVAPTLSGKAAMLLCDRSEEPLARSAIPSLDLPRFSKLADSLSEDVRTRFRIREALEAAKDGRVDPQCRWRTFDVPMLVDAEPIAEIQTVEELVDVTSSAVEHCECPDTPDRILSGIARLSLERCDNFDALTKPLAKRACDFIMNRPVRGIAGGFFGSPFSLLIGAWLGVEPDENDREWIRDPTSKFIIEVEQRVRQGTGYPLLSSATHRGGWIDPQTWVLRLKQLEQNQTDFLLSDLIRSLLRLAPDGRQVALENSGDLSPPWLGLASAALGGTVVLDETWPATVWITALRARDPWLNLADQLSEEERFVLTPSLERLPDVVFPSDYQWRAKLPRPAGGRRGLVDASPCPAIQEERSQAERKEQDLVAQYTGEAGADGDLEILADALLNLPSDLGIQSEFFTAELHDLRVNPAPAFTYPYLATQWPMKLDWYWCLATIGLSRRVESKASVEERYSQFLLPLFEPNRPLTRMAARAVWIALISKDTSAKSMATEIWIALIAEDRFDVATIVDALADVAEGGWVKYNRVSELLAEIAAVSPLHTYVVGSVLEQLMIHIDLPKKDLSKLIEPLDECHEELGRAVSPELTEKLAEIKTGKAKTRAKSLLSRQATFNEKRRSAIDTGLEARFARASM